MKIIFGVLVLLLSSGLEADALNERHEMLMLAAMSYVFSFSKGVTEEKGAVGALIAWDVENLAKTPTLLFERRKPGMIFHAERMAMDRACAYGVADGKKFPNFETATLYSILEPCPMCSAIILMSSIRNAHYCFDDPGLRDFETRNRTIPEITGAYAFKVNIQRSRHPECARLNHMLWAHVQAIVAGENPVPADLIYTTRENVRGLKLIKFLSAHAEQLFAPSHNLLLDFKVRSPENRPLYEKIKTELQLN